MPTPQERTLIRGGVVLSFDSAVGDFERADVLIEGEKIVAVRPDIGAEAQVIDASQTIVLPGFIDTHHHHYHEALRNVLPNGLLKDYFRDAMTAAASHYRPEDAYVGNLIRALRAIDAGVTTVTDTSGVSHTRSTLSTPSSRHLRLHASALASPTPLASNSRTDLHPLCPRCPAGAAVT
jgi:5-methylthioadenosine/S-adenosylhomocysteine deaminase